MTHSLILALILFPNFLFFFVFSWIWVWGILELLIFLIVPYIHIFWQENRSALVLYFLVQSIASLGVLIRQTEKILVFFILIKMGIFPFHFWVLKVGPLLKNKFSLVLITVLQKILPLRILRFCKSYGIIWIFCIGLIYLPLSAFFFSNFIRIFLFSRIIQTTWFSSFALISPIRLLLIWLFFYASLIFSLILKNQSKDTVFLGILLVMLGGIPPFLIFLLKVVILRALVRKNRVLLVLVFLISRFLTFILYLNFLRTLLISKNAS